MLEKYFSLANKLAVVTGGGGHLCSAISEALCETGAHVIVCDLREEKASSTVSKLKSLGYSASSFAFDASSDEGWETLLEHLKREFQTVDVLVNGAGINDSTPFFELSLEQWRSVFASQIDSTFLGCQKIGKLMCDQKSGSIINISSASSGPPLSKAFAYSCAKSAIVSLTQNLAREWAQSGVRVNAVRPGFFPTEWNRKNFITPDRERAILGHTPMARYGVPEELKAAIIWLSSQGASFTTGSEIAIDGGFSCMTI